MPTAMGSTTSMNWEFADTKLESRGTCGHVQAQIQLANVCMLLFCLESSPSCGHYLWCKCIELASWSHMIQHLALNAVAICLAPQDAYVIRSESHMLLVPERYV